LGLSSVTTRATVPGTVGNLTISIAKSENDIDENWTYILEGAQEHFTKQNLFTETIFSRGEFFEFDPDARSFNRSDENTRDGIVQPVGLGLHNAFLRVRAYDNLTRWQSDNSCEITVDISKALSSSYCGTIADPATTLPTVPGGTGEPAFPLVNLTALSESTGTSLTLTAMALGFAVIGTAAIVGLIVGGGIFAIILATVGACLAAALSLIPPWWLVVIFMGAMTILIFGRGKGE
jgi:hypothetical protein